MWLTFTQWSKRSMITRVKVFFLVARVISRSFPAFIISNAVLNTSVLITKLGVTVWSTTSWEKFKQTSDRRLKKILLVSFALTRDRIRDAWPQRFPSEVSYILTNQNAAEFSTTNGGALPQQTSPWRSHDVAAATSQRGRAPNTNVLLLTPCSCTRQSCWCLGIAAYYTAVRPQSPKLLEGPTKCYSVLTPTDVGSQSVSRVDCSTAVCT